jgi:hypothetical protein
LSYLCKMNLTTGQLQNSTYVAEFDDSETFSSATVQTDANLDGWWNPNSGWLKLNTTYLTKNSLKITADGSVVVIGKGRRTVTTANAYQKMVKPAQGRSAWNSFVRMYTPSLNNITYSSLVVGQWNTTDATGGDNIDLYGVWKTTDGIIAVGKHKVSSGTTPLGNNIPVTNVPAWGASTPNNESAVLVYYTASNLNNTADAALITSLANTQAVLTSKYAKDKKVASLAWQFTNKSAVKKVQLQYAANNNSFESIASFNNTGIVSFQHQPTGNMGRYRLEITSNDNVITYSNITNIQTSNEIAVAQLYPTMVTNAQPIQVQIENPKQLVYSIKVTNESGAVLKVYNNITDNIMLPTQAYNKGIYFAQFLHNNATQQVVKFVVK